jgi:hypothetical protein
MVALWPFMGLRVVIDMNYTPSGLETGQRRIAKSGRVSASNGNMSDHESPMKVCGPLWAAIFIPTSSKCNDTHDCLIEFSNSVEHKLQTRFESDYLNKPRFIE